MLASSPGEAACGEDEFLIAVVGNKKPAQVVEPLIQALVQIPSSVHVAFVGRGHDETVAFARRAGVESRVHAVGQVHPEEVVPFIRSADAAAMLYRPLTDNDRYLLPNGFFQSIAAGLPLLRPDLARCSGGCTTSQEDGWDDCGPRFIPARNDRARRFMVSRIARVGQRRAVASALR